ncbi:hypothetical protein, partial [Pseudomonas syringae group genomosp. 7]|uniref:hypothetical protein n=1 Tax=Pseudomonas syringae group genomosp. 7 TaxID=251699 RepID=UPI00377009E4
SWWVVFVVWVVCLGLLVVWGVWGVCVGECGFSVWCGVCCCCVCFVFGVGYLVFVFWVDTSVFLDDPVGQGIAEQRVH